MYYVFSYNGSCNDQGIMDHFYDTHTYALYAVYPSYNHEKKCKRSDIHILPRGGGYHVTLYEKTMDHSKYTVRGLEF
jgi:hypothetical protein